VARNKQTTSAFEILFFENVLKEAPDFIEALIALGDLYTKEGYYQKGLARLRPDDGVVLYNLACSYSLINDVPRAREAMKAAFKNGYEDIEHLVKDTDLLNLLADTQFVDILKDRRKPRTRKSKMTTKEGA
jgi:tetratricopeptide (TPR) repeat protein